DPDGRGSLPSHAFPPTPFTEVCSLDSIGRCTGNRHRIPLRGRCIILISRAVARPCREPTMTQTMQRELFQTDPPDPTEAASLFADIVFDRPLDDAYTYAVPDARAAAVAVGSRRLPPTGGANRTPAAFGARLSKTAPARPLKKLLRVLEEEALLPPTLWRLTRWMAASSLCGGGQVLNAVAPA